MPTLDSFSNLIVEKRQYHLKNQNEMKKRPDLASDIFNVMLIRL